MSKEDIHIDDKMVRLNSKIISSPAEPVYTKSTSTSSSPVYSTCSSNASNAAMSGTLYSVTLPLISYTKTSGAYFAIQLANPSTSTKTAYLNSLVSCCTDTSNAPTFTMSIYGNATMTSAWTSVATALTIVSRNLGLSVTSALNGNAKYSNVTTNVSYVNTGSLINTRLQTASLLTMLELEFNGDIIIPPGSNYTISINSNGTTTETLGLMWWEV